MKEDFLRTTHSLRLIGRFVHQVFPLVDQELKRWHEHAKKSLGPQLYLQATDSLNKKKFHCQGGSVYSLYGGKPAHDQIRLIVALQTISDYLDNLCDRAGVVDEQAFRQLHLAMTDALDPTQSCHNYYAYYPYQDDLSYLTTLVKTCQEVVASLPSYNLVKEKVLRLATWYSELQTVKHLDPAIREEKFSNWLKPNLALYPDLYPQEFAAATGSTLGMFMLCAAAAKPHLSEKEIAAIDQAYFPWIQGLHILFDYLIDYQEDLALGELNFMAYYESEEQAFTRLRHFYEQSMEKSRDLENPYFAQTVILGLFGMYLSDPKIGLHHPVGTSLMKQSSLLTKLIYEVCRLLRLSRRLA